MSNEHPNPGLSFSLRADWLKGRLRADKIRHDTLAALLRAWHDGEREAIIALIDSFDEAARPSASQEMVDAATEEIEAACAMELAQIELRTGAMERLASEATDVAARLGRTEPTQLGRFYIVPAPTYGQDR